jgi:hypothetical protein
MLVRQLIRNEPTDAGLKPSVVAEFWMEGGELRAEYKNKRVRAMLEAEGISSAKGILYPSNGKPFFDRLPVAMEHLTLFTTRDVKR